MCINFNAIINRLCVRGDHVSVGDSDIHPVPLARNFDCWFDSRLSMASHITKLFASLFYHFIIFVGSESIFHGSQPRYYINILYSP